MKIQFHGATGDVTGSAYHVMTRHASILVDCGLFQGGPTQKGKNRSAAKLEGGKLDAVVLTHGHLDHIVALPVYVARRRMMKMTPPVVDTAPPRFGVPVVAPARPAARATPNGTCQRTEPSPRSTAVRRPQGGCWHGRWRESQNRAYPPHGLPRLNA